MRAFQCLLVTGGAGFMGSNFIRFLFREANFKGRVINVDKLTYAGDPANLQDLALEEKAGRYKLEVCDICDGDRLFNIIKKEQVDGAVHFAAESHVDRSIASAGEFARTNVLGTLTLLEVLKRLWGSRQDVHFHHISTDEVFGSCPGDAEYAESDPYDPSSPYAASKAGADHMVRAFGRTHGFPFTITNATNNYGPYQTPEKLIPLVIMKFMAEETVPVYGKGDNIREWLFVDDHSRAVWTALTRGSAGESYNAGSHDRIQNLDLVRMIGREVAKKKNRESCFYEDLIAFVPDRPGHDRRYALNSERMRQRFAWRQALSLQKGIERTVDWYCTHPEWIERARNRIRSWLSTQEHAWAKKSDGG